MRSEKEGAAIRATAVIGGTAASRCRGMTLIEVLVASVLLGVGVAGLTLAAALGLRNQERSSQRVEALYLCQEKLAEVEVIGPRTWAASEQPKGSEERDGTTYHWAVTIEAMTEGELHDVRVEVNWDAHGRNGKVELQTLLNDYQAAALEPAGRNQPSPLEMSGAQRG